MSRSRNKGPRRMRRVSCTGSDRNAWCSFCRGQLGGHKQARDAVDEKEARKEAGCTSSCGDVS